MDRSPVRDFIVGLFVLGGIAAIAYLSISIGGFTWHGRGGLKLHAFFPETGGLTVRSPVSIAGVQVGEVTAITLDENGGDYRARVDIDIDPKIKLSTDTFASIYTSGMLGDRYVSLKNGSEDKLLANNGEISHTEKGMILEQVMGDLIYGITKTNPKDKSDSDSSHDAPGTLKDPFEDVPKKKLNSPATAPSATRPAASGQ